MINKLRLILDYETSRDCDLEKYAPSNRYAYWVCVAGYNTEEEFLKEESPDDAFFSSGKEANSKFGIDPSVELNFGAIIYENGESYFSNRKNAVKMFKFVESKLKELGYEIITKN